MGLTLFAMLLMAMIAYASSIRVVHDAERLVVFRLGRFLRVAGPGLVVFVPSVDRGMLVRLNEKVPGWQGMAPAELEFRVRTAALEQA